MYFRDGVHNSTTFLRVSSDASLLVLVLYINYGKVSKLYPWVRDSFDRRNPPVEANSSSHYLQVCFCIPVIDGFLSMNVEAKQKPHNCIGCLWDLLPIYIYNTCLNICLVPFLLAGIKLPLAVLCKSWRGRMTNFINTKWQANEQGGSLVSKIGAGVHTNHLAVHVFFLHVQTPRLFCFPLP